MQTVRGIAFIFPELTSINTKTATSLMAKPDGKVHLDGITTIKEGVTTMLTGTEVHHLEELAMPNLAQVSPQSLGHLDKTHRDSVGGTYSLDSERSSGDSRHLWSHHQLRDRGDDGEGNRFVVPSPRQGRSFFSLCSGKISDPKVLEKVGSLQYFLGLHQGIAQQR